MEEQVEEIELIATQVSDAFKELSVANPSILIRFREAFTERAETPGLPESKGGSEGLTEVFAGLLGRFPSDVSHGVHSGERGTPNPDESFNRSVQSALATLKTRHPLALSLLKKHWLEDGRPLEKILEALLGKYCDNKAAIPY